MSLESTGLDGKKNEPRLKTLRHHRCVFRKRIRQKATWTQSGPLGSGTERDQSEPAMYSPK